MVRGKCPQIRGREGLRNLSPRERAKLGHMETLDLEGHFRRLTVSKSWRHKLYVTQGVQFVRSAVLVRRRQEKTRERLEYQTLFSKHWRGH